MTEYQAVLMHGEGGGEGGYRFEGPPDLLEKSAVKVASVFMAHLYEITPGLGHIGYELNAAMKNGDKKVLTLGSGAITPKRFRSSLLPS